DRVRTLGEVPQIVPGPVGIVPAALFGRAPTAPALAATPLLRTTDRGRRSELGVALPGQVPFPGRDAGLLGVLGVERVMVQVHAGFGDHGSVTLLRDLDEGAQVDDVGDPQV